MKFGGFGNIKDYRDIKQAGYDFAELDMPEIEELSDYDFTSFAGVVKQENFPVLTGARILPVKEPLFFIGDFRPESLREYLRKSCGRSGELGIKKIILGNGKARSFVQDSDRQKEHVFIDLLGMMAGIAAENGQELIPEPLGPKYSNYINTVPEAVEVIKRVGASNLFTMADLRHMLWSKENFSDLVTCKDYIHHVHIDYPVAFPERRYPDINDGYDYGEFFAAMKESGYDSTLTVEAETPNDWSKAHGQLTALLKKYC